MKVWVAVWGMYSSQGIGGVYKTAESAMRAHDSKGCKWQHSRWGDQKENESWTNGLDWEDCIEIEPFELED